jgi:hypothetical protein
MEKRSVIIMVVLAVALLGSLIYNSYNDVRLSPEYYPSPSPNPTSVSDSYDGGIDDDFLPTDDKNKDGDVSIDDLVFVMTNEFGFVPNSLKNPNDVIDYWNDYFENKVLACSTGSCTLSLLDEYSFLHPDPDHRHARTGQRINLATARINAKVEGPKKGEKCPESGSTCKGVLTLTVSPRITNPTGMDSEDYDSIDKWFDDYDLDDPIPAHPTGFPFEWPGSLEGEDEVNEETSTFLDDRDREWTEGGVTGTFIDVDVLGGDVASGGIDLGSGVKDDSTGEVTWTHEIPVNCGARSASDSKPRICSGGSDQNYRIEVKFGNNLRRTTVNYKFQVTGLRCCGIYEVTAEVVDAVFENGGGTWDPGRGRFL